jgi:hypothetical protein
MKKNELLSEIEKLKNEIVKLKKLAFGDPSFIGSNDDEMVLLKLNDYTTEILARVRVDVDGFKRYYVMRGDGRCFCYGDFGVEWVKKLKT